MPVLQTSRSGVDGQLVLCRSATHMLVVAAAAREEGMGVRWMHQGRTGCDERTNEPLKKWDRHGIESLLSGTLKPASGGFGEYLWTDPERDGSCVTREN